MILRRTSISATEPVTLDEMKAHLRVSTSSTVEDAYIQVCITAARELAENKIRRAIIPQQWRLVLDDFPDTDTAAITLPFPPLSTENTAVAITFLKDDTLYSSTTLSTVYYTVDSESEPGRVYPSSDNEWPSCVGDIPKAVTIDYRCGYATSSDVPESIKSWIKLRVGSMFEHRESLAIDRNNSILEFPRSFVDGLLDRYVVDEDV